MLILHRGGGGGGGSENPQLPLDKNSRYYSVAVKRKIQKRLHRAGIMAQPVITSAKEDYVIVVVCLTVSNFT